MNESIASPNIYPVHPNLLRTVMYAAAAATSALLLLGSCDDTPRSGGGMGGSSTHTNGKYHGPTGWGNRNLNGPGGGVYMELPYSIG